MKVLTLREGSKVSEDKIPTHYFVWKGSSGYGERRRNTDHQSWHVPNPTFFGRERKMRTNFFCTHYLNTPKGPGHPGIIPGTSQIPLFETQGRQTFGGGQELFGHRSFAWKTPTPPSSLRNPNVNLCVRADFREGEEDSNFSIFRVRRFSEWPEPLH